MERGRFMCLEDLEEKNNDAERALRHVVLGRKNFMGSLRPSTAEMSLPPYTP
jgi:hypothetical protein